MALRDLHLPNDLTPLSKMIVETFHYPENPEWSVQTDEKEFILETISNLSQIWWLIRLLGIFSKPARDLLCGCIWEEDGKPVGTTIVQRRGSTKVWIVGTVGVLPAYRRRGIARSLVERSLEIIREKGGEKAWLDVIDGNLPAHQLYESLGFEEYSGHVELQKQPDDVHPLPDIPEGYRQEVLKRFDWRSRYDLEKRISPPNLLKYEPVEEKRFRHPLVMRLLIPIIQFAQGTRDQGYLIRDSQGIIAARHGYSIPRREKGFNELFIRLDPKHNALAPYLVGFLLNQVTTLSPSRKVQLSVPLWMEAVQTAGANAGFQPRLTMRRMGIVL
jgi:GNAT superfamily N-acetyltransferase